MWPMKYLMLIYGNETVWNSLPPAEMAELIGRVDAFNRELRDSGELISAEGLVERPRSVRRGADGPVVTDGPYLEAKEYVGSMFVVDVVDEDRALEIAKSYPGIRHDSGGNGGGLEMWPLMTHDR
jgi:hypothetical protein